MAIIELSVIPLGTETTSLSQYVAQAVKILENEKDVKYQLTPMGTVIEGELAHILSLAQKMHESAFASGAMRVVTVMKIDDRRDKPSTMSAKVAAVKQKLQG